MLDRKVLTYIFALLGISYIGQIYILLNGGIESEAFNTLAPIIMFLPALLAIAYVLITGEGLKSINWRVGKPIYLVYGALIPALLALMAAIMISSLGWGEITHFTVSEGQVIVHIGRFILGNEEQSWIFFALNFLLTALIFPVLSGVVAFGEELGWRGFLQGKLIGEKGLFRGIMILGLVWGFWHFPLIANGYNYPETPILGAFILFPLTTVFASFFLAWLTLRSGSFWPAVLGHGSVNAFIGSIVAGMEYSDRLFADIFMVSVWGIIAFLAYQDLKKI